MRETIRRVVVHSVDDVRIERVPQPSPSPGQVLVRPSWVGICGSDTHASLGRHPFIDLPYRPGHEVVGVVEAVGDEVTGFADGDRVVVEPNLACGTCPQCRAGRYNICRNLAVFGCQTPGGLADAFTVPASRLHHVPDHLPDRDAVLAEPLATPVRARTRIDATGRGWRFETRSTGISTWSTRRPCKRSRPASPTAPAAGSPRGKAEPGWSPRWRPCA